MLSRMLLHVGKAFLPVDLSLHCSALFQSQIREVKDPSVSLLYVQHMGLSQGSRIRRLASSLRIKRRPVKFYLKSPFHRRAGNDPGCENAYVGFLVK